MDPNAALTHIRDVVAATLSQADDDTSEWLVELCESIDGLDGWISRGGFLPDAWSARILDPLDSEDINAVRFARDEWRRRAEQAEHDLDEAEAHALNDADAS